MTKVIIVVQYLLFRLLLISCQAQLPLCPPSMSFLPPGIPLNCIMPSKMNNPPYGFNMQGMFPMMKFPPSNSDGRDYDFTLPPMSTLAPPVGSMGPPTQIPFPLDASAIQSQMLLQPPPPPPPRPMPPQSPMMQINQNPLVHNSGMEQLQNSMQHGENMQESHVPKPDRPDVQSYSFDAQTNNNANRKSRQEKYNKPEEESQESDESEPRKQEDESLHRAINHKLKRLVVSPVLAYVTKDGHVMYQKKLNDVDALYWLKKEMAYQKDEDEMTTKNHQHRHNQKSAKPKVEQSAESNSDAEYEHRNNKGFENRHDDIMLEKHRKHVATIKNREQERSKYLHEDDHHHRDQTNADHNKRVQRRRYSEEAELHEVEELKRKKKKLKASIVTHRIKRHRTRSASTKRMVNR